ncbi:MAG: hypothetical protein [Siphoviridae sp. ctvD11]|nr:MAG: hypothetical protein [Siphoviridae sp. ctvD11]
MSKIAGRSYSVGAGKESVRGTSVAASYWLKWAEINIEDRVETVTDEMSVARLEDSDGMAVVHKYADFSLKTKLMDTSIGLLFLSLFGTDTPVAKSAPNAAVYDHTYSIQQGSQHQSLTLAVKSANDDLRFALAMVDRIAISAAPGGYVMVEVSGEAKVGASATNTVAHVQENEFVPQMLTFKKAATQADLGAASAVTIRSFNIEMKQNIEREKVLGNVAPNDILNKQWDVSGSVVLTHNDATYHDLMVNETYQALRFDFLHTATIGTSANPELKIDLHRARITNYQKSVGLNDIITESFDFKGMYSLTDSKMITPVLTNLVAAY